MSKTLLKPINSGNCSDSNKQANGVRTHLTEVKFVKIVQFGTQIRVRTPRFKLFTTQLQTLLLSSWKCVLCYGPSAVPLASPTSASPFACNCSKNSAPVQSSVAPYMTVFPLGTMRLTFPSVTTRLQTWS